jgi:hypothetical protein
VTDEAAAFSDRVALALGAKHKGGTMSARTRWSVPVLAGACLAVGPQLGGSWALAAEPVKVVASGLVNPRGLAQAPNGWIYVAEAGNADGDNCLPAPPPGAPLNPPCLGLTGAVTRIDPRGKRPARRIVSGLPSVTRRSLAEAVGPHKISFLGTGGAFLTMGLGGNVALRESLGPDGEALGHLLKLSAGGAWRPVADLTAHEDAEDPDGVGPDSNPYGILARPFRRIATDAGGNSLVEARPNGTTRTLAVFPSRQILPLPGPLTQSVPTAVDQGPDGWLYVGELTGFPFPAGGARVWRVPPGGGTPEVCATGFTTIVDLTFDEHGHLYVLEFASGVGFPPNTGRLSRLDSCRARTDADRIPVDLSQPGGVLIARDGAAYVTNKTLAPFGTGEVLRIPRACSGGGSGHDRDEH